MIRWLSPFASRSAEPLQRASVRGSQICKTIRRGDHTLRYQIARGESAKARQRVFVQVDNAPEYIKTNIEYFDGEPKQYIDSLVWNWYDQGAKRAGD